MAEIMSWPEIDFGVIGEAFETFLYIESIEGGDNNWAE